jgi:hypothetical protein
MELIVEVIKAGILSVNSINTYMCYLVLVIALIDYILYELLKNHNSEDQDESTKYSQIMKIKPECLSTADQVRHNLIDVINRLQQRSSTSSSNKS